MMIEPPGSSLKVIGSSSATVSAGPMPGSTPTAVPSSTPMSANSRFIGWMAMVRPWARDDEGFHGGSSDQAFERTHRQGQGEKLREKEIDDHADARSR